MVVNIPWVLVSKIASVLDIGLYIYGEATISCAAQTETWRNTPTEHMT